MSTRSDDARELDVAGEADDAARAAADVLARLPDPAALARLATEMFRALPGAAAVSSADGFPFAAEAGRVSEASMGLAPGWAPSAAPAGTSATAAVAPALVAPPLATPMAQASTPSFRYPRDGDLQDLLALGDDMGTVAELDTAAMAAAPSYYFLDTKAMPSVAMPSVPAAAVPPAPAGTATAPMTAPGAQTMPGLGSVMPELPGVAMATPLAQPVAPRPAAPVMASVPGLAMATPPAESMLAMPPLPEIPGVAMGNASSPSAPVPGWSALGGSIPTSVMTMPAAPEVPGATMGMPTIPASASSIPEMPTLPGTAMSMPSMPRMPLVPGLPGATVPMPTMPAQPGSVRQVPDRSAVAAPVPAMPTSTAAVPGVPASASDIPTGAPAMGRLTSGAIDPVIVAAGVAGRGVFDAHAIRRDFPILHERVHGKPLVWLDNGATTQKPRAVIDRISRFYERDNSNIHRAAHALAARSTDAYEAGRESVRRYLNAPSIKNIVFVRGATEGLNLVAQSWGRRFVGEGDEIVLTHLEHHSNIVPWQLLCAEVGARIKVAPVDDDGQVLLDAYERLFGPRTRLAAIAHVSNALGTVTPVRAMTEIAHRRGARVVIDGAQAVSHLAVDVQALGADYYVFSGHKVFGPTGIGAVYGSDTVLDEAPPWQGGGNMIADVTFERTVYQPPPARFEAGTGSIADAVGLGAALDYVMAIGLDRIAAYEHDLLEHATRALREVPGLRVIGTAREKAGVLSFVLDGYRSEEVGAALDLDGIAVRAGHHCAQPILRRFGLESTVRASLAMYNLHEEIDLLADSLRRLASQRRPTSR